MASTPEVWRATIEAFSKTVGEFCHLIKEDPELVFPLIYNRLQWKAEEQPDLRERLDRGKATHRRPWLQLLTRGAVQQSQIRTMSGHRGSVGACAFSPSGDKIASWANWRAPDRTYHFEIKLWDAETGKELADIIDQGGFISGLAFSRDGEVVLSVQWDGVVKAWSACTGEKISEFRGYVRGHFDQALSPSGRKVALAGNDGPARIVDIRTGEEKTLSAGRKGQMTLCCAFSPDGRKVVSGGTRPESAIDSVPSTNGGALAIWNIPGRKELFIQRSRARDITRMLLSPDGKLILTAARGDDCTLDLWDAASCLPLFELKGHEIMVSDFSFSPDGSAIITSGYDSTLRLWETSTGRSVRVLRGHERQVMACAFGPGGRLILSAGFDHTVRLWDASTGEQIRVLYGHPEAVWACAFSRDGMRIVSGSEDGTIMIWDVKTGGMLMKMEGHYKSILSCCMSRDGKNVLSESSDRTIRLWDAETGRALASIQVPERYSKPFAFSPESGILAQATDDDVVEVRSLGNEGGGPVLLRTDHWVKECSFRGGGKWLMLTCWDNFLSLWDVEERSEALVLSIPGFEMRSWAVSPDETRLYLGGRRRIVPAKRGQVTMWDAETGQELWSADVFPSDVMSCAFSPDGSRVLASRSSSAIAGDVQAQVRLLDAETGRVIATLDGHQGELTDCAFSPDGSKIATAGEEGLIFFWDGKTGRFWGVSSRSRGPVSSCMFSADGRVLLSACKEYYGAHECSLSLWDSHTAKKISSLTGHGAEVLDCKFSPDGKSILSAGADGELRLWDSGLAERDGIQEKHDSWISTCRYSPDGKWVVSASDDETLKIWDSRSGVCLHTLRGHTRQVQDCAFTPDGKSILSANWNDPLLVWDADGKRMVGHHHVIRTGCFAISPDGRLLATVGAGHKANVLECWDMEGREKRMRTPEQSSEIYACSFSPDGTKIVTSGKDGVVTIWDAARGDRILTMTGHEGAVHDCCFSPEGGSVLSAGRDANLCLWDSKTGGRIAIFRGHTRSVNSCAFSPDGTMAVSGSSDVGLRIWDIPGRKQILSLKGHCGAIQSCCFSPDGTQIAAGDNVGQVLLFQLIPTGCSRS